MLGQLPMNSTDILSLTPLILVASSAFSALLLVVFQRRHRLTMVLTLSGLGLALASLAAVSGLAPRQVTSLLVVDAYSLFCMGLVFAAALAIAAVSYSYFLRRKERDCEEFYALLLIATVGAGVLVCSGHFASFVLGLEILGVALYGLAAYSRTGTKAAEAGVKYLAVSAASAAFLLFGGALVYADMGTLEFSRMQMLIAEHAGMLSVAGLAMVITGMGFKLGTVPFHTGIAELCHAAPAPVGAYVAAVYKGAILAFLFRCSAQFHLTESFPMMVLLLVMGGASMFAGNVLALRGKGMKRVLAYLSVAQAGCSLILCAMSGWFGSVALGFFFAAYFVVTAGGFLAVAALSVGDRDTDRMEDYRSLMSREPWIAGSLSAVLLLMASIPFAAAFVQITWLIQSDAGRLPWWLGACMGLGGAIGLYGNLRLVISMCTVPSVDTAIPELARYAGPLEK